MYNTDEYPVKIGVYDDHVAFVRTDELEYICLCEECAEERGAANVTHLDDMVAGQTAFCDDCGRPNRTEEEEEEEEYEDEG